MRKMNVMRMLIIVCGLLALGCKKETLPTKVSTTDQGSVTSSAVTNSAVTSSANASPAEVVYHDNFDFDVDFTAPSVCAGEDLHFTGHDHLNAHLIMDAKGGFHGTFMINDHNFSAVGLTTGIMYHEVGATVDVFNVNGTLPYEETFVITLNFIGQGPGNNAINREIFHVTINANGILTVIFDTMKEIRCQ